MKLYRKARALAAELGFSLDEAATGGASDGNFTSALGIPTLDGMGAVGEGAHAAHESVVLEHLGAADGAAGGNALGKFIVARSQFTEDGGSTSDGFWYRPIGVAKDAAICDAGARCL